MIETANKELKIVSSWLTKHKLVFKTSKMKYMIFSTKPHKVYNVQYIWTKSYEVHCYESLRAADNIRPPFA